jgi:hypothetical protein
MFIQLYDAELFEANPKVLGYHYRELIYGRWVLFELVRVYEKKGRDHCEKESKEQISNGEEMRNLEENHQDYDRRKNCNWMSKSNWLITQTLSV